MACRIAAELGDEPTPIERCAAVKQTIGGKDEIADRSSVANTNSRLNTGETASAFATSGQTAWFCAAAGGSTSAGIPMQTMIRGRAPKLSNISFLQPPRGPFCSTTALVAGS